MTGDGPTVDLLLVHEGLVDLQPQIKAVLERHFGIHEWRTGYATTERADVTLSGHVFGIVVFTLQSAAVTSGVICFDVEEVAAVVGKPNMADDVTTEFDALVAPLTRVLQELPVSVICLGIELSPPATLDELEFEVTVIGLCIQYRRLAEDDWHKMEVAG